MDSDQSAGFLLRLLGSPALTDDFGRTPPSLGWGKPLALLCLLAVRGEVRREEVVDLLWRDIDEAKARNAFRQALHRLRSALGEELIPQDRERLRLVRSDHFQVDLDRFQRAVNAGRLDEALQLYQGDFLENTELGEPAFDIWTEHERTRIQVTFRQVLHEAVAGAAGAGNWTEAIARARRLLGVAPFDAGAAQLAATTLISAGRRAEAQDLLRQFESRLQSELGLTLPAELQSLTSRIGRQQGEAPAREAPARAGAPAELALPFVGREAQLSQLLTLWRTTREDAGALVLIEGDLGLGKSRLTRELASHAKSLGPATVLVGRERANAAPVPFGLFAEALRPLVRAKGVSGASRHLLAEAARLLPELRDNFDLPPLSDVEDEAARVRFFEGVAALIDAAAYEQPILLVLEDLHAIAPSSLDLLSYLTVRLAGSATMFVLTFRDADAAPVVIGRVRSLAETTTGSAPPHGARAQRLTLAPLSASDSFAAASQIGQPLGVPTRLLERVAQRAEGSPARLLQLMRHAAAGDDIAALPVSLRELMSARLHQLTSAQRRLLVVIGMIDRPVSVSLAADAAHLALAAARESVEQLEEEGLVERSGDEVLSPDLAAQVALEAAGSASRAFLAAWIAEALARDPRTHPAELARFFALAGQGQPAFENARRAAYAALVIGAVAEAVQLLTSARTFASTPQQQEQIESQLTALGSGRRRIAAPAPEAKATDPQSAIPTEAGAAFEVEGARWWKRLFPNWRILFGAAVATLLISASVLATRAGAPMAGARSPSTDTLVVTDGQTGRALRFVTGDLASGLSLSGRVDAPPSDPPWLDSLSRPWADAVAAPGGRGVAVAKVTLAGSDVYFLSSDRRDTVALVLGQGDSRPLGWSPDGRWLLASTSRTLANAGFDADLRAYRMGGVPAVRAVDTTARRAITEAVWSPDGTRIAWVARVGGGDDRQLEIFMSLADGSDVHNVSRHPADDFHISWSSDGELLAYTSTRDGNAELYAMAVRENRLWRLTRNPAQDDRGAFSPNGRLIAFESTRGGSADVYVMPGLGGDAQRVGSGSLSVGGWRGGRSRYIDRIRVELGSAVMPGDTTSVRLRAVDQFDEPIATRDVELGVLDTSLATLTVDPIADTRRLSAKRTGLARLVGGVGRWRSDTAFVRIGNRAVVVLQSVAANPFREWRPLGVPAPTVVVAERPTVLLNAGRQWESGILSRAALPLLPGLTLTLSLEAPLSAPSDRASTVTIALVAPEDERSIQMDAPQFLSYAALSWNADATRLVYSVGREVFSEPVNAATAGRGMLVKIAVEHDSTVSFTVDDRQRWRSTLRVIDDRHDPRVQVWIGGRATGDRVRVSNATVVLAPASASSP